MGAHASSGIFYNRVKGEMEAAVAGLGYGSVCIARPSLIEGDRAALGQTGRAGEGWALAAARWLRPLVPANYRSVAAGQVARALHARVCQGSAGVQVLLSGQLQKF